MSEKIKLWGVIGTSQVFTTEENAKTYSTFMKKGMVPNRLVTPENQYNVHEIFPDCFVNKIKKGYETFRVGMTREGKVLHCTKNYVQPTRFGFTSGRIVPSRFSTQLNYAVNKPEGTDGKMIAFTCLAADEREAVSLCDAYRIKTLIDDIWFKKEGEF